MCAKLISCVPSKRKLHRAEKREKRAARVDIFEPVARLQSGCAGGENDVFRKRRAIRHADAEVFANAVANRRFKQNVFKRLGALKTQVIEIREALQLRRDVKIRAGICKKDSRIDEIRLALFFARTKRRNQASVRRQLNAGAQKTDVFTIPETENPTSKVRQIVNRIETARAPIARIRVAGSIKSRGAIPNPVMIVGDLDGRHLRIHRDAPPGDRIERILADGLIKRVRQIDAPNVPAAQPAEIANANTVRQRTAAWTLIDHVAHWRWPHKKTVIVVVHARIILVPSSDEFRGVTWEEKVLQIDVRQHNLLVTTL